MISEDKQNRLRNRHQYMAGYHDGRREVQGCPRMDPPWFGSVFYMEGYRDGQADERNKLAHRLPVGVTP
jgi:hypothetical protein